VHTPANIIVLQTLVAHTNLLPPFLVGQKSLATIGYISYSQSLDIMD
jgi:hypothetical protein